MTELKPYHASTRKPLSLLAAHPSLANALLAECKFSRSQVETLVEPVLRAPDRCQLSPYYIQAVLIGHRSFLATNLTGETQTQVIPVAAGWSLGRSLTCAIAIPNRSISRCHAIIGHHSEEGLYITDIGSSNGTWVNRRRLPQMERQTLRDGDLLRIGTLDVEFFIASSCRSDRYHREVTYS